MGRQPLQSLDFPKVVNFFDVKEVGFHALDGHLAVVFNALRLKHFGEGAFTLLRNQPIF